MIKWTCFISLICLIYLSFPSLAIQSYDDLFGSDSTTPDYDDLFSELETTTRTTTRMTTRRTTTRTRKTTTATQRTTTFRISSARLSDIPDADWEDTDICELHEKCVPYYLCKEDGNIITDGSFLIDERFDNPMDYVPETCPALEQCCKKVNLVQPTRPVSPGGDKELGTENKKRPSGDTSGRPTVDEDESYICTDIFSTPDKCGFRNPKGLGGFVNSMQNRTLYSQYAEFPWMMAVLVERYVGDNVIPFYQCGGSLIHPRVVMTTAHNLAGIDPKKIVIRGGEWDTQTENEMCGHKERKVERIIRHEKFTRENLQNNIALIILEEEFEISPFINTVCLPPEGSNFDNKRCLSCGWGKTKFGKAGIHQVFLKKVELPIVPNPKCQDQLRKTRLGPDFVLHDSFLCAGGEEGKDTCTGDGGSPLMCEIPSSPGHYYQAGIVAGGVGCGEKDVPGFYVNVAKYRDWIDSKLESL